MAKQIQSIERGLYILESILFDKEPVTATEIARRLGVHKSTISHLTATLVEQGFLARVDGSTRLVAGPEIYRVARAVQLTGEQIMRVPPALERLAADTDETAHLAELRGRFVIYLANSFPERSLRVQTEAGAVEAAHSTAVGKALLAWLPVDDVRSQYEGVELESFTDRTIGDIDTLLGELERVRSRGFATDQGEQTGGTCCLAAPVRDARGVVVASVGISGPEIAESVSEEKSRAVLDCAAQIEELL